ncbi:MAG: ATP-dependent Clp protease proteolytic subunit [Chitinophagales bacterium]|nr:ATP-dependent Clp protease proteolytic subunit [Chitinophagales bacterium]
MEKVNRFSDIYVELSKYRNIFLCEEVTKDVAVTMSALLFYYDAINNDPIRIYINSNGGDVMALYNIYDVMQIINSPIYTICIGKAYSAAAVILAAGSPGHRYAFKHSDVMIHGLQCLFATEKDAQASQHYFENKLIKINDNVLKLVAKHTKQPLSKIKEDSKRDFFLQASEAKKYGIVDHVL